MNKQQRLLVVAGITALVVLILLNLFSRFYTDYLWFESQGQTRVWWNTLLIRSAFYAAGAALVFLICTASYQVGVHRRRHSLLLNRHPGRADLAFLGGAAGTGLLVGGPWVESAWQRGVLAWNSYATRIIEPMHGLDAAFYMFELPWRQELLSFSQLLIALAIAFGAFAYLAPLRKSPGKLNPHTLERAFFFALPHLGALAGLLLASIGLDALIERFELVYSGSSSRVAGPAFVDVYARAPAMLVIAGACFLAGAAMAAAGFMRSWRPPLWILAALIATAILVGFLYPRAVYFLEVYSNEITAERPYIERSIQFTRRGYGLDRIARRKFEVEGKVTERTLSANRLIIDNIRLWDYRPTRATFNQLQALRQYYEFRDVDVDRYIVNGAQRQVMISARELDRTNLPERSRTWESRHLQYTHGYGIVMAPTNRVTRDGLPELWIKDFPPHTVQPDAPRVQRPGIYYGELTDEYVIVGAALSEIDYPTDQNFSEASYEGKGGVEIGSGFRKFLIALQFDTWKMMISEYLKPESRILYHRNIREAAHKLAPFLQYDDDPYVVVGPDGRLYWLLDAYTISARFPMSAPLDEDLLRNLPDGARNFINYVGLNYIRNSVKIVVDAYDGTVRFYVFDERDAILRAWMRFYPGLFRPMKDMPEFLKSHLRYPQNLFSIQTSVYTDYHMDDPQAFFNLEDRWQIATEVYEGAQQMVEPYYTVLKLADNDREEFVLMQPFIPNNKQNMIAWMAARSDYSSGETNRYGELIVYDFPRTRQIYGPIQIESRIDQDPEISKDLALWNQQGSRVIRGNLLVIPIENTLLYVEPIYLQSTKSPFPELRRVVVADPGSLVMESSLGAALNALASAAPRDDLAEAPAEPPSEGDLRTLAGRAMSALKRAEDAAGDGDWAEYGRQMNELQTILDRMANE